VIPTTSVSRPRLKSNPMGDRVMRNNSQGKKQDVEDPRRSVKFSKNKTSVTACNDSLNAKTLNVNFVCATCDTCVLNEKHDICVLNSVAKPLKKIVASESNQKPRNITRKLYERVSKTCSWWYPKFTPSGYKWKPNSGKENVNPNTSMPLGTVYRTANILEHMTSRKSTCYIRDFKGNDLLTGSRGTDLYSITLQDTNCPNLICFMAKASSSQAWLWHRRLSYLNFDTINLLSKNDIVVGLPKLKFVKDHLCSSCELGKAKRKSFHSKLTPSSKRRLQLLHMDLCGPMRVASNNGKRYVLVIVDDYSRYTWTHFLRSKDEKSKVLINFLRLVQRRLQAQSMALEHDSLSPAIQRQANVPQADRTVTTSNELDFLFSPMSDKLLNGSSKVVSKSFAVSSTDAPNQRQQHTTSLNNHTTPAPTCQVPTLAPTVTSSENINQAETYAENDQVADDEFINILCTPVQDRGESSSRHVDSSNMHTFYQRYPSEHRWTKDHPL
nr:retrovirus-related Pol polyprotein from transposon TNT 1-94 [Tanacetum cinerariifolium]